MPACTRMPAAPPVPDLLWAVYFLVVGDFRTCTVYPWRT
jgi:hypothetical protein